MTRHIGKAQRVMKEQTRNFFAPKKESGDPGGWMAGLHKEREEITPEDREAAMKKLQGYGAPLKDWPASKEEEDAAAVPSYREFPILRKKSSRFRKLIEDHILLSQNISLLEGQKASLRGEIQLLVELAGQKSVLMDTIMVTRTEGRKPSEKIDRKKITRQLQKRGFTADDCAVIVNASIVKGRAGRPSIVVTDTSKPRKKNGVVADE